MNAVAGEYTAPRWYTADNRPTTPSVALLEMTNNSSRPASRARSVGRRPHTASNLQRRPASHCGRRNQRGFGNNGAWASASRPRSAMSAGGNYMRSSRSTSALPMPSSCPSALHPGSSTAAWRPAALAPISFFQEHSDSASGMKLQMNQLQADAENIQAKTSEARRTTDGLRVTHGLDNTIAEFKLSMGAELEKAKSEIFYFLELGQAEQSQTRAAVDTLDLETKSIKSVVTKMRKRVSSITAEIGYA